MRKLELMVQETCPRPRVSRWRILSDSFCHCVRKLLNVPGSWHVVGQPWGNRSLSSHSVGVSLVACTELQNGWVCLQFFWYFQSWTMCNHHSLSTPASLQIRSEELYVPRGRKLLQVALQEVWTKEETDENLAVCLNVSWNGWISNQLIFKRIDLRNRWTLDEAVIRRLQLISVDSFKPHLFVNSGNSSGGMLCSWKRRMFPFWPPNKERMDLGRSDLTEVK